ncbi:MAG: cysteine desulfurase NifS [Clostridiales bacterium]|jgi:cysteine desulfurase|nr:cysteine desulfurase NifS [Clostridiales bacterium]
MTKRIYADNAATTKVAPEVVDAMLPYFTETYGNPSSIYNEGRTARVAVEKAREQVANAIGASPKEIYFTGSGSEADNWALRSTARALSKKGNHIITSAVEHHAVLHTCQDLEKQGFEVTYLPVDKYGMVSPDDVKAAVKDTTIMISIMFANNEIGTIMPIAEIGKIAKEAGVVFHTDAVQAVGNVEIDVKSMNIDMLSLTAHKFHGPKGCGALYVRQGVKLMSFITGGAQERMRRAGTENVPGIVGLGKAIELATANIKEKQEKLIALRDRYIKKVLETVPYSRLNGHPTERLAGNANISFEYIEGEGLLLSLDMKGIAASSGSACTSGSLDPSHVLLAIGLKHEQAHGSLRTSFGEDTTVEDIDYMVDAIAEIVARLRSMSPLYEDFVKSQNK